MIAAESSTPAIANDVGNRETTGKKRIVGAVVLLIALVIGTWWGIPRIILAWTHETTDDAFVEAPIVSISPKISGYVAKVLVSDNQHVQAGDVIAQIDPRDYQAKRDEADASLKLAASRVIEAKTQLDILASQIDSAKWAVESAEAESESARVTAERYRGMSAGAASEQEKTLAFAAEKNANAQLQASKSKLLSVRSQRASLDAAIVSAEAQVKLAETKLAQADLDLSYTRLAAPSAGHISKKNLEPGQYIQPGQSLLAIVTDDRWVIANFKETQLRNMKIGDEVDIHVDAFPKHMLHGKVQSVQEGTGARFSLLPPENATGNYVKVVQRVPVKITLQQPLPDGVVLAPGMSVVPSVKISK